MLHFLHFLRAENIPPFTVTFLEKGHTKPTDLTIKYLDQILKTWKHCASVLGIRIVDSWCSIFSLMVCEGHVLSFFCECLRLMQHTFSSVCGVLGTRYSYSVTRSQFTLCSVFGVWSSCEWILKQ